MRDAMRSDRGIYREAILQLSVWSTVVGLNFSSSNSHKIHKHKRKQWLWTENIFIAPHSQLISSHSTFALSRGLLAWPSHSIWGLLGMDLTRLNRFAPDFTFILITVTATEPQKLHTCVVAVRLEGGQNARSPDTPTLLYYPRVVV